MLFCRAAIRRWCFRRRMRGRGAFVIALSLRISRHLRETVGPCRKWLVNVVQATSALDMCHWISELPLSWQVSRENPSVLQDPILNTGHPVPNNNSNNRLPWQQSSPNSPPRLWRWRLLSEHLLVVIAEVKPLAADGDTEMIDRDCQIH